MQNLFLQQFCSYLLQSTNFIELTANKLTFGISTDAWGVPVGSYQKLSGSNPSQAKVRTGPLNAVFPMA